jgi:hypothetical protein
MEYKRRSTVFCQYGEYPTVCLYKNLNERYKTFNITENLLEQRTKLYIFYKKERYFIGSASDRVPPVAGSNP